MQESVEQLIQIIATLMRKKNNTFNSVDISTTHSLRHATVSGGRGDGPAASSGWFYFPLFPPEVR